jgi:hypothetical protein
MVGLSWKTDKKPTKCWILGIETGIRFRFTWHGYCSFTCDTAEEAERWKTKSR